MKIKKTLADKIDRKLCMIESGATIRDAAKKMTGMNTGSLMVVEKDNAEELKFAGIITRSDIVRAVSMEGSNPDTDKVDDFMTRRMIVAAEDDDVEYIMNVMVRHNISYLPVIEGKTIGGVISRADILESLNVERDIELHWLSDYTGVSRKNEVY